MKKDKKSMFLDEYPYDSEHPIESALLSKPAFGFMFGSTIFMFLSGIIAMAVAGSWIIPASIEWSPLNIVAYVASALWAVSTLVICGTMAKREKRHFIEKMITAKNTHSFEAEESESKVEEQVLDLTDVDEKDAKKTSQDENSKKMKQALNKVYDEREQKKQSEQNVNDVNNDKQDEQDEFTFKK